jgi:hypothetical protein
MSVHSSGSVQPHFTLARHRTEAQLPLLAAVRSIGGVALASSAWLANLRPRFDYLAEVWAPRLSALSFEQADALQWRAGRYVLGLPSWANSALVAAETGWMSMRGRFALLSLSFLMHLNGRAPVAPVAPDRFLRRVFDATTTPQPLAFPWSARLCRGFQADVVWRFHCRSCRHPIGNHADAALVGPARQALLAASRAGVVLPLPRDFSLSPWVACLARTLQHLGLDVVWLGPDGPPLPPDWRTTIRAAIVQHDRAALQASLDSSAQHLSLYRQVIRGPGEFFRWRKNTAPHGVSEAQLLWWCKLRAGQLPGYGINNFARGELESTCIACHSGPDSPEHFLLGGGCVVHLLVPVWGLRRHRLARLFRGHLLATVGADAALAYVRLPFRSRLLVSLGQAMPGVDDAAMWPCWAASVGLWQDFWQLRAVYDE